MTLARPIARAWARNYQRGVDERFGGLGLSISVPTYLNSPETATFKFSADVTGFVIGDIVVTNGTPSAFVTVDARTYTATITPTAEGAVTIDVAAGAAVDGDDNENPAKQRIINYDLTDPGLVITALPALVNGPFTATFTFDEPVSGFTAGDIVVGNGTAGAVSGMSDVYTSEITPTTDGAVTIDVAASVCTDLAGNDNTIATQVSTTADLIAPTCVITGMVADFNAAFTATFTFSESVTGFALGDISVGNGVPSSLGGSGAVYTATITPTAQGVVTIDVAADAASDAAGNGNTAATQVSGTYDSIQPTVSFSGVPASITDDPFTATVTFSESVTGFVVGDIVAGNATLSSFSGSGSVYTVSVQGTATGTITLDISAGVASDAAGNTNTAATQATCSYTGGASSSAAKTLIDTYSTGGDGFAMVMDDADISAYISDSGTPANDFDYTRALNFDAFNSLLSGWGLKNVLHADGDIKYAAHNVLERSNTFTSWSATGTPTLTIGQSDPDGGTNATRLAASSATDTKIYEDITEFAGTSSMVIGVKAKYVSGSGWLMLYMAGVTGNACWFDIQNGVIGTSQSNGSPTITSLGDGWYLCENVVEVTSASSDNVRLELVSADNSSTAGATDGIDIYDAFAGLYPMDTSGVMRTADSLGAVAYATPIEHNAAGNPIGLLVEPEATNLITESQDHTAAVWVKTNISPTLDATGPDGVANSAMTITTSGGGSGLSSYRHGSISADATTTYTFSFFAKADQVNWVALRIASFDSITNAYSWFDITNGAGAVGTAGAGQTLAIEDVGGGWFRCSSTFTTGGSSSTGTVHIVMSDGDGDTTVALDGTVSVFTYGAQVEAATSPTSLISTAGSTVTRAEDVPTRLTSAIPFSATVGAVRIKYRPLDDSVEANPMQFDDTTANEVVAIGHTSGAAAQLKVTDGAAAQTAPLTTGTVVTDTSTTIAATWKANDFLISKDGATAVADTGGTLPTLTRLLMGKGVIEEFVYVPEEKTAAETETMATP